MKLVVMKIEFDEGVSFLEVIYVEDCGDED